MPPAHVRGTVERKEKCPGDGLMFESEPGMGFTGSTRLDRESVVVLGQRMMCIYMKDSM